MSLLFVVVVFVTPSICDATQLRRPELWCVQLCTGLKL